MPQIVGTSRAQLGWWDCEWLKAYIGFGAVATHCSRERTQMVAQEEHMYMYIYIAQKQ